MYVYDGEQNMTKKGTWNRLPYRTLIHSVVFLILSCCFTTDNDALKKKEAIGSGVLVEGDGVARDNNKENRGPQFTLVQFRD